MAIGVPVLSTIGRPVDAPVKLARLTVVAPYAAVTEVTNNNMVFNFIFKLKKKVMICPISLRECYRI